MSSPLNPDDVVARLEDAGVRLDRALTEADVKRVQKKYAFTFPDELRDVLRTALPSGDAWLNWRHATPAKVKERMAAARSAAVTAAETSWPAGWGSKPADVRAAVETRLQDAPVLIPLYALDFLPETGGPVLRATDRGLAVCADSLTTYLTDFDNLPTPAMNQPVPVWSDLL